MSPKKQAAATAAESTDPAIVLQLDPLTVLADDNTRFNLKDTRIQTLADSIVAQNGVIEPVEVEPIPEDAQKDGYKYRLTLGFYRHAAVKFLNTTQAAGLTLPAIIHLTPNPVDRLRRQIAENIERENQSPMDQAISIKRLLDAGIPKMEVRQMFSRPGGRKGSKVQPASNSFINMTKSFLDLPKTIQEKIHTGVVGVRSAYELTKVDPERRTVVLERAETARQKELEQEEKDEEKFLNDEKKRTEQEEKVATAKAELEAAEAKAKETHKALEDQTELTKELFAASKKKYDVPKDKKAAVAAFNDAEKKSKVIEVDATEAQKAYEKAEMVYSKLTEKAEGKKDKASKEKASKEKVSPSDIQKAAKEVGAAVGAVQLTASEIRKVVAEMALPSGNDKDDAKLKAFSEALTLCFAGVDEPKLLYKKLLQIAK